MPVRHPTPIPASKRIVGYTPSGQPLLAWSEIYPDGSIRDFEEFWTSVTTASGTTYGLSLVRPVTS